ncbi:MAG: F0F1 ATP synthase subunit A [Coriobacteriales bacterium]|nr:F0F1 ATP synthase subunit A [Actinomycetes bacterium]
MSAPVVPAAEASPMGEKIAELLHELSVRPFSENAAFSLTNYTFWLIIAVLLLLVFMVVASRKAKLVPSGIGNLAEAGVELVRNSICVDIIGPEGKKYFPFIGTIFFFVLFNNLLGNIPPALPGTGTVGTTFTWAIIVFLVYNGIGIKKVGFGHYIKSFVPAGTPMWLAPLIFVIEVISHLLRPFTLGIRLFANMYAGHIMLGVFAVFVAMSIEHFSAVGALVVPLSFLMQVVLRVFELFVAVLQAYIFSILTAVYINGALHTGEH